MSHDMMPSKKNTNYDWESSKIGFWDICLSEMFPKKVMIV